ncbi:MAG: Swt1 family HEPN domain-containing protein [Candidatus Bathyarchaeia archaeon]
MTSFVIIVDSANIDRTEQLTRILGARAGGSSSQDLQLKNFSSGTAAYPSRRDQQKTELTITHDFPPDSSPRDFVSQLRSIFPEMQFKSEFLDRFRNSVTSYKYVHCRGFICCSREGIFPQDVMFLLSNNSAEDEVVTAQDPLDSTRKQFVFVKSWPASEDFIQDVLEPWLVSATVKVVDEIPALAVEMFTEASMQILSEIGPHWPGIPVPSILFIRNWRAPSHQESPDRNWPIATSRRPYADLESAFVIRLEKPKEYMRYNCCFALCDGRGRILDLHVEPATTGYDLVVPCEISATALTLKVSYSLESNTPEVRQSNAQALNRFNMNFLPTNAKAELLASGTAGPELIDRYTYQRPSASEVATSITQAPHVTVTTQISLPVDNQVLIGAQVMVEAYARFFIMENTLRTKVKERLHNAYGTEWVNRLLPVLVTARPQDSARIRRAAQSNPDEILEEVYYSDLKDVIDTFWSLFEPVFKNKERTFLKLTELESLRNDIAHNRVLADHDIKRIQVYYMDLLAQ